MSTYLYLCLLYSTTYHSAVFGYLSTYLCHLSAQPSVQMAIRINEAQKFPFERFQDPVRTRSSVYVRITVYALFALTCMFAASLFINPLHLDRNPCMGNRPVDRPLRGTKHKKLYTSAQRAGFEHTTQASKR